MRGSHLRFHSRVLFTALRLYCLLSSSGSSTSWMRTPPSSLSAGSPVGLQSLFLPGLLESGVSSCYFCLAHQLGLLARIEERAVSTASFPLQDLAAFHCLWYPAPLHVWAHLLYITPSASSYAQGARTFKAVLQCHAPLLNFSSSTCR